MHNNFVYACDNSIADLWDLTALNEVQVKFCAVFYFVLLIKLNKYLSVYVLNTLNLNLNGNVISSLKTVENHFPKNLKYFSLLIMQWKT